MVVEMVVEMTVVLFKLENQIMLPRRPVLRLVSNPTSSPRITQSIQSTQGLSLEDMVVGHAISRSQQPQQVQPRQVQTQPVQNVQPVRSDQSIQVDPMYAVDGWQELKISDQPAPGTTKFIYVPMYKTDLRGLYNVWRVGFEIVDSEAGMGYLEMRHGVVDGTTTINRTQVTINQSGRNILQQGLLEARRRYLDKFDEGYRTAEEFGSTAIQGESGVMKAHIWMSKTQTGNYRKQTVVNVWPVYVQAKLDGIRVICRLGQDGRVGGRSKDNKVRYTPQHVYDELELFMRYFPNGTELDGELYSHDMTFPVLSSVANTGNRPGGMFHPRVKELKYFIFDIIDPGLMMVQEDRYALLINAYKRYLEDRGFSPEQGDNSPNANQYFFLVSTTVANSDDEVRDFHNQFVALGYEGIMIRRLALGATTGPQHDMAVYKRGRSYGLLKHKSFLDEEALVLAVDSTSGRGTEEGLALLTVQDRSGNILPSVRSRGSFEQRRQWSLRPETIIGKVVTIRFQERSEYGVPRFPVVIGLRSD
jgi:hypothetical protein